jgi:hypothetical protein
VTKKKHLLVLNCKQKERYSMARPRKYIVNLSTTEEKFAKQQKRKAPSQTIRNRYSIVLLANKYKDLPYKEIGHKAGVSEPCVIETLKSFCLNGFEELSIIGRNPRSDVSQLKADGDIEARIVAKACEERPEGTSRWTVSLLTEEMSVILQNDPSLGVESLSRATVGRILTRNEIKPYLSDYWCIPPEEDANFVASMEDVLDVYKMPYDPKRPVWCMDEKPYQLLDDARKPIPMRPGDVKKIDSEYVRCGTVSIFCFIQPLTGKIVHHVEETRTAIDWAEKIKYLIDEIEPDAEKIILVMDNLNTHSLGSLYKAFPPQEARSIARRLEVHYTPKHGSWLNIAEIGINIITRECLNRRIEGIDTLRKELNEWSKRYEKSEKAVNWQFTADKARTKLKKLYPDIDKERNLRDKRRKEKQEAASTEDDANKPNTKV